MLSNGRTWSLIAVSCLLAAPAAEAALQTAAGKVNTSVGLTKANAKTATQQWQLATDPTIPAESVGGTFVLPPADTNIHNYFPTSGVLDNTFDPTQFKLALNSSGQFALGDTVQGLSPFEVTSFKVLVDNVDGTDTGSYFLVQQTANPLVDLVTPVSSFESPDAGQEPDMNAETGAVNDITFDLVASEKGVNLDDGLFHPLPVDEDQNFYQINLIPLEDNPDIQPLLYSSSGDPDGSLTISDGGGNTVTTTGPDNFTTSYLPEPGSVALIAMSSVGLMKRRRSIL
jgi:hypothetical protein